VLRYESVRFSGPTLSVNLLYSRIQSVQEMLNTLSALLKVFSEKVRIVEAIVIGRISPPTP
jgi:hypothetical protein